VLPSVAIFASMIGSYFIELAAIMFVNSRIPGIGERVNNWALNIVPALLLGFTLVGFVTLLTWRIGEEGRGLRSHVRRVRWAYVCGVLLATLIALGARTSGFGLVVQLYIWPLCAAVGCILGDVTIARVAPDVRRTARSVDERA
jgi:hypothetical protein